MNDTEFEDRLARLLNDDVDRRLGPPRPAPAWHPQDVAPIAPHHVRWRRVLPPLLAAAAVAGIVTGLALIPTAHVASPTPMQHPTTSNAPSTSSTSPSTTPSNSTTAPTSLSTKDPQSRSTSQSRPSSPSTTSRSSRPSNGLGETYVHVAGATLTLPPGWRPVGKVTSNATSVCITTHRYAAADCAITFFALVAVPDVDKEGGGLGDVGEYCGPKRPSVTWSWDVREMGGRQAEWRKWVKRCPTNPLHPTDVEEQYVVPTPTPFVLFGEYMRPMTVEALDFIAANSTLPRPTGPLRLSDFGRIVSVRSAGADSIVRVRRLAFSEIASQQTQPVREGPVVTYDIPPIHGRSGSYSVGQLITVTTNGRRVTGVATR